MGLAYFQFGNSVFWSESEEDFYTVGKDVYKNIGDYYFHDVDGRTAIDYKNRFLCFVDEYLTNDANYDTGLIGSYQTTSANVNYAEDREVPGWDNSKTALDIGGALYGSLEKLTVSKGYWLGKNGKYYTFTRGANQYTGSYKGALRTAKMYKNAGRVVTGVSVVIGGIETYNGYQADGGRMGYNAWHAAASNGGSVLGGLAGAAVGAEIGAAIGVWFGGVGAIPGAVIGGAVGTFFGGIGGGKLGSEAGEGFVDYLYDK